MTSVWPNIDLEVHRGGDVPDSAALVQATTIREGRKACAVRSYPSWVDDDQLKALAAVTLRQSLDDLFARAQRKGGKG